MSDDGTRTNVRRAGHALHAPQALPRDQRQMHLPPAIMERLGRSPAFCAKAAKAPALDGLGAPTTTTKPDNASSANLDPTPEPTREPTDNTSGTGATVGRFGGLAAATLVLTACTLFLYGPKSTDGGQDADKDQVTDSEQDGESDVEQHDAEEAGADADVDVDSDTDTDSDSDGDADGGDGGDGDQPCVADCDQDRDEADGDADTDTDADLDSDADPDVDADPDGHVDADPDVETDTDPAHDADLDTDEDADTEADAEADAEVDGDADTFVPACPGIVPETRAAVAMRCVSGCSDPPATLDADTLASLPQVGGYALWYHGYVSGTPRRAKIAFYCAATGVRVWDSSDDFGPGGAIPSGSPYRVNVPADRMSVTFVFTDSGGESGVADVSVQSTM